MINSLEHRLIRRDASSALKRNAERISSSSASDPAARELEGEFSKIQGMIRSNHHAQQWRSFWEKKEQRVAEKLEAVRAGGQAVGEVRREIEGLQDAFSVYAIEGPEKMERQKKILEMMKREGTISADAARRFILGSEKILNDPAIHNRRDRLKYLDESTEWLLKTHEIHKSLLKEYPKLEKIMKEHFQGGEFTSSIAIFSEEEQKREARLFHDQFKLLINGDLAQRKTPLEFLQKLKAKKQKAEKERQDRLNLFRLGQPALKDMKNAFQNLGYAESIAVFAKCGMQFEFLRAKTKGKGGLFRYYDRLWKVAGENLETAQAEALTTVQAEREKLTAQANWKDSLEEHRALLRTLVNIPTHFRTKEMNVEMNLLKQNIKLCLSEVQAEPFEKKIRSEREDAEKRLGWEESLQVHEELKMLCEIYGLRTKGIQEEYDLVLQNIALCRQNVSLQDEKGEGKLTASEFMKDWMRSGETLRVWLLASFQFRQERKEGREEMGTERLSAEEFKARARERAETAISPQQENSDPESSEATVPGNLQKSASDEQQILPGEIVTDRSHEVEVTAQKLHRGSTRDKAIQAQEEVKAIESRKTSIDFTASAGGPTLRTRTELRERIARIARDDMADSLRQERGMDLPALNNYLKLAMDNVLEVTAYSERDTRNALRGIQEAQTGN